jgi:6-phosphofructokinase 1
VNGILAIAQSGGPTAVINASLSALVRAAQRAGRFAGIYGLAHGLEGALSETFINLSQTSADTLEQLAHTPAAALGSTRHKLTDAEYEQVFATFRRYDVRAFVYIGGNGSMWVCNRLAQMAAAARYEMQIIGVPKTIDNDLPATDHTPGYGSAARFVALATRDTGLDLEAMVTFDDVIILEAMGRDTGWLAAASALGKSGDDAAPHLVYVPELPFDEDRFLDDVARAHATLRRVFVVIGEGIRDADGYFVGQRNPDNGSVDSLGRVIYALTTGPSAYLFRRVREKLGLQARFLRPGIVGRSFSACVSAVDHDEALLVGRGAFETLAKGHSGVMVTLERTANTPYTCRTSLAPLAAANGPRRLPREFINAAGNHVTPAFIEYARPLVGALSPIMRLTDRMRLNSATKED